MHAARRHGAPAGNIGQSLARGSAAPLRVCVSAKLALQRRNGPCRREYQRGGSRLAVLSVADGPVVLLAAPRANGINTTSPAAANIRGQRLQGRGRRRGLGTPRIFGAPG